jgi:hypothetical protein
MLPAGTAHVCDGSETEPRLEDWKGAVPMKPPPRAPNTAGLHQHPERERWCSGVTPTASPHHPRVASSSFSGSELTLIPGIALPSPVLTRAITSASM